MVLVVTRQTLICYYCVAGKCVACGSAFNSAPVLACPAEKKEVLQLTSYH